jgi:hypothetical protein
MPPIQPDVAWEGRRPDGSKVTLPVEGEGSWDMLLELIRLAPPDTVWTYHWATDERTPRWPPR